MEEPAQHAGGGLSAAAHRQPPTRPQQHGARLAHPAYDWPSWGDPQGDEQNNPGVGNALGGTRRITKLTKAIVGICRV